MGFHAFGLLGTLKTFEDPLRFLTMCQVIPRVFVQAAMVDLHTLDPPSPQTFILIVLTKTMRLLHNIMIR